MKKILAICLLVCLASCAKKTTCDAYGSAQTQTKKTSISK